METKHCLACDKIIKGRIDKKFCDDYCRNNYNNQLKGETNNLMRNINNALRKNRKILEDILRQGETSKKTNRDKLLLEGFQFKYFTHNYTTQNGNVYFFCYEYGYLTLENDWYLVVKRNEE